MPMIPRSLFELELEVEAPTMISWANPSFADTVFFSESVQYVSPQSFGHTHEAPTQGADSAASIVCRGLGSSVICNTA